MPPKRRGGATRGRGGKRAKKADPEPEIQPEPSTSNPIKDSMAKLKRGNSIKKKAKPDAMCPLSNATVHEDYDCMLNQTNIGHNNNKYYIIQVLEVKGKYYTWNRWGRVVCFIFNLYSVRTARNTGIMFLNEVVLGKEHHITMDNWQLTAPPKGHHCIIAKGRMEPDPKFDTTLDIEGKEVVVPQGAPIATEFNSSNFYNSEYLVYKESQNRIRYMLKLKF